jgi:hypothetical protein
MLPNEVMEIIILHMHDTKAIRSLANLGLCSKRLQSLTEWLVWKEVKWKKVTWLSIGKHNTGLPPGWRSVE